MTTSLIETYKLNNGMTIQEIEEVLSDGSIVTNVSLTQYDSTVVFYPASGADKDALVSSLIDISKRG